MRRQRFTRIPILAAAMGGATSLACSGALAKGDGRAFGDDMGRFHVTARLETSTCGPGAIGAPDIWQLDVILSRERSHLYWNTGADAVEGALYTDGRHFDLTSETVTTAGGA